MSTSRYPVPVGEHEAEIVEKKSRFIATAARARSPEEAKAFVQRMRARRPDARHHCFAYVAGPAGSSHPCGMSDDGEPHGTAGRPMLQILTHCGVGEIIVVVSRYFGGIKLGTGGLVRAYSDAVKAALETLPTEEAVDLRTTRLRVAFEHEQALRHQLASVGLSVTSVDYGSAVEITTEIAADRFEEVARRLQRALPRDAIEIVEPV